MARQSCLKSVLPLIVGFLFGSMVSIFLIPNYQNLIDQDVCTKLKKTDDIVTPSNFPSKIPSSSSQNGNIIEKGKKISPSTTINSKSNVQKSNRPRFLATELGVKDKLFVGVITSRTNLQTIAAAINKTVAHHVSKLMFFLDAPFMETPSSNSTSSPQRFLNLVNIASETPANLKPMAILNYISGRGHALANNYDWFFFAPDNAYLKAYKLFELVSHMSFGYDVQIGRPLISRNSPINETTPINANQHYCDFNAGVLISYGLMRQLLANLRQCMKLVDPKATASENFGKCILYANPEAKCKEEWNGKLYRSWPLSRTAQIAFDLAELGKHDSFNSALTVYPIFSSADIFHLHKYYCNQEIDQVNQLIGTMEQSFLTAASSSTNQNDDAEEFLWPPGLGPASKQRSRYELLKWDYFTNEDIFETNNDKNIRSISGLNEKDLKQVVDFAVKNLIQKYSNLKIGRLSSGYRRFDPKRGMEYMLDLKFETSTTNETIRKRVDLIRPLNRVELVPVPYVTEATPVVVVVPVSPGETAPARDFLDRFSRYCLDVDENAKLIFVLFYETRTEQESYKDLIAEIETLRKKYGFVGGETTKSTGASIGLEYVHIRSSVPSMFLLMDLMLQTIGGDHLYLMATPWTEVYGDFLNRVRMNTIKEFQIFSPIPFAQFNPKIVYRRPKSGNVVGQSPEHIDVNKNVGRFDRFDFNVISFYGSDYYFRRKRFSTDNRDRLYFENDLLSLFLNSTLHIFRAVEPVLKIRYHEKWCDPRTVDNFYEKCSQSRKEGLGTKAQLANLLFEFGAIDEGL